MRQKLWVLLLVAMSLGLGQPAWSDDLYVVVGGGRAVGTPITPTTSLPCTISQPGFYYLTGNLSSSGNAITIAASEVTLDLMGFSITGSGPSAGFGIYVSSGDNVEVRNGSVKNFNTGIGTGTLSSNRRFANLRVSGCTTGIIDASLGVIITGCQAANNTTSGIVIQGGPAIVDKNTAFNNTVNGFQIETGGVITNNVARLNGTGFSLMGNVGQLVDRNCSYGNTTANWSGLINCTQGINTP